MSLQSLVAASIGTVSSTELPTLSLSLSLISNSIVVMGNAAMRVSYKIPTPLLRPRFFVLASWLCCSCGDASAAFSRPELDEPFPRNKVVPHDITVRLVRERRHRVPGTNHHDSNSSTDTDHVATGLHLQCFAVSKGDCCRALEEWMMMMMMMESNDAAELLRLDRSARHFVNQQCLQESTEIPGLPLLENEDTVPLIIPPNDSHSFWYSLVDEQTTTIHDESSSSRRNQKHQQQHSDPWQSWLLSVTEGTVPPPLPWTGSGGSAAADAAAKPAAATRPPFVEDAECRVWRRREGRPRAAPEASVSNDTFHAPSSAWSRPLENRCGSTTPSRLAHQTKTAGQAWTASLHSSMSEYASRGMHWDLQHRLVLRGDGAVVVVVNSNAAPQKQQQQQPTASMTYKSKIHNVNLVILLHVPKDLFVNVEDLLRIDTVEKDTDGPSFGLKNGSVALISPKTVIDQEELAFHSPSHALLLHVTASLVIPHPPTTTAPNVDFYSFDFVTKWHSRYPKPFPDNNNHSTGRPNFRLVTMPTPELIAGNLYRRVTDHDPLDDMDDSSPRPILVLDCCSPSLHSIPIWVAAGHQQDYSWVLTVTVLVAILGAAVMMRDIAAVSVWD